MTRNGNFFESGFWVRLNNFGSVQNTTKMFCKIWWKVTKHHHHRTNKKVMKKTGRGTELHIVAYWSQDGFEIAKYNEYDKTPSPGIIRYFLKHSIIVYERCFEHWFAYCEWFHLVNTDIRYRLWKSFQTVWSSILYTSATCTVKTFTWPLWTKE